MPNFTSEIEAGNMDSRASSQDFKQGHSFCGCCCDMQRSVIIVNLLNIMMSCFALTEVTQAHKQSKRIEEQMHTNLHGAEELSQALVAVAVLSTIGWILSIVAIYGAYKFRFIPVLVNVIYIPIHYIIGGAMRARATMAHNSYDVEIEAWFATGVFFAIYLYPQIMYLTEVRSGILSSETWSREKRWFG